MNETIDLIARAHARERGAPVPVRTTWSISGDPDPCFGIAPIKLVSEEIIQALAFGPLHAPPTVMVRWNPLSRDTGDLETFASALHEYVIAMLDAGELPRIWVPHRAALDLVELLGFRYRTNREATETLRTMGAECRVLAEEAALPGQQAVAVARQLLAAHAVTGQAPVKDGNLLSLLAWHEAAPNVDPAPSADAAGFEPASGMLVRRDDDRAEALRFATKKGGRDAERSRRQLEALLRDGALREWDMLVRGRAAFWALGLEHGSGIEGLVNQSVKRLDYRLRGNWAPPARPAALARLLDEHEYAADSARDADDRGDARQRERARRAGRAFTAQVDAIDQAQPNRHPCVLALSVRQDVLRVRLGTTLSTLDGRVAGGVERISELADGSALLHLRLANGVRASTLPVVGSNEDWTDSAPFAPYLRRKAYAEMDRLQPSLVYDDALPVPRPRSAAIEPLVDVADRLRRS